MFSQFLKKRMDKHLVEPPEGESKVLNQSMSVNLLNYWRIITQKASRVDTPWLSYLKCQQLWNGESSMNRKTLQNGSGLFESWFEKIISGSDSTKWIVQQWHWWYLWDPAFIPNSQVWHCTETSSHLLDCGVNQDFTASFQLEHVRTKRGQTLKSLQFYCRQELRKGNFVSLGIPTKTSIKNSFRFCQ